MATYGQLIQFGPFFNGGLICTLKVYHYIVSTTSLKDVYVDREKGSTAAQPVVSDANGIVSFYADGIYKFRIDGSTDGVIYTTLYTYDKWAVSDLGTQTGEGAAITAASTLVLGTDGDFFHVTGATGITAISGTQTRVTLAFDSTPTLTYSGSLILQNGTSYTVAAGDVFVFINEGAGVWREQSRSLVTLATYAAYSTTASIADNVRTASLSGASFTLSLPAAANNTNRIVTIIHSGTNLTQVYTIQGNGAETIDGTNTYLLYTNGERLTIQSTGANWVMLDHYASTNWVDAGVMTITGTGGNPTKPTTPDIDKVYWRRDGSRVYLRYILQISSATGGVDGTGAYLFALPTNITMDTTILTPVATALSAGVRSEASASYLDGRGVAQIDSVSMGSAVFFAYDTTHFQAWRDRDGTDAAVGSASAALSNAELSYNFELNMRAANWRL